MKNLTISFIIIDQLYVIDERSQLFLYILQNPSEIFSRKMHIQSAMMRL